MMYKFQREVPPVEDSFASRCIEPSMHAMVAQYWKNQQVAMRLQYANNVWYELRMTGLRVSAEKSLDSTQRAIYLVPTVNQFTKS